MKYYLKWCPGYEEAVWKQFDKFLFKEILGKNFYSSKSFKTVHYAFKVLETWLRTDLDVFGIKFKL